MKWSYSKYNKFTTCPRAFKYEYIDRRRVDPRNDNFAVGEGVHKALEYYANNPQASEEACVEVYRNHIAIPKLQHIEAVAQHEPLVRKYYKAGIALKPTTVIDKHGGRAPATEVWFELDCLGALCVGKIDIITIDNLVIDYKTSSKFYSQYEVDDNMQLSLYAAAFQQMYGRLPDKVGIRVLLKPTGEVQDVLSTRTQSQIDDAKQRIRNCEDMVKLLKEFQPKRSAHNCRFCSYKGICENDA